MQKAVFPGKYIQGAGALAELPALVQEAGSRVLVLASLTVHDRVLPESELDWGSLHVVIDCFQGECCEAEIRRLQQRVTDHAIDVIVGMGGGKTLDTAKIVADRSKLPVIVVPSIASTDAPCSGCAVIYSDEGVFESVAYQGSNPRAVLVDLAVIAAAPVRFLVAGMGDALSTWFEARSCQRTHSPNECGGYGTMTGFAMARLCYETLLSHGAMALESCRHQVVTPALERIVEANTLLSGLGFESAGLAAAHAIHNGLTVLGETHASYHGEKVAFGVLAGLVLSDADPQELETVFSFCESVGLPTTLAELGLDGVAPDRLMAAAVKCCSPEQSVHHEAVSITPRVVLNAMLVADALGRQRKRVAP